MMTGMYAAISGLDANQVLLDDTASDLANVNTVGYKSSSVTFAESLTQVMHGASGPTATNGGSNPVQIGLGVQVSATRNEMSEGSFQTTNNPLDVAIEGKGFLRVGSGTPPAAPPYTTGLPGNVNYTRAGDLSANSQGFITTEAGEYVIGHNAVATETPAGITYAAGTGRLPTSGSRPDPPTSRSARTDRSPTPTRTPPRPPTNSESPPAISPWPPSPTKMAWNVLAARSGAKPPTRAPRSWAPPTRPASAPPLEESSRCQTWTSPAR